MNWQRFRKEDIVDRQERVSRVSRFSRALRQSEPTSTDSGSPALSFLQPIAAPSILGLLGFAAATFMVSANLVGWYGNTTTLAILAPFAATFGGIGQIVAAVWGYKARDGIATGMHGAWGLFWLAFGILWLLIGTGTLPALTKIPAGEVAYGYWFAMLAAVTLSGALAAMRENLGLSAVLHALWIGSGVLAIALIYKAPSWEIIGGYVLMLSAIIAWYTATALMFQGVGWPVLPVGETRKAQQKPDFDPGAAEPGVQHGQ